MNERDLLAAFPAPVEVPAARIAAAVAAAPRTLVVLDDDPTGTQSVAGLPVLTSWEVADLAWRQRASTRYPDAGISRDQIRRRRWRQRERTL